MSYKSALHVLATVIEHVVPVHNLTLFWITSISGTRAVSAVLHTSQLGAHAVTEDPNSGLKPPKQKFLLIRILFCPVIYRRSSTCRCYLKLHCLTSALA